MQFFALHNETPTADATPTFTLAFIPTSPNPTAPTNTNPTKTTSVSENFRKIITYKHYEIYIK